MKKRIISVLLMACMLMTMLPVTVFGEGEPPDTTPPTIISESCVLADDNSYIDVVFSEGVYGYYNDSINPLRLDELGVGFDQNVGGSVTGVSFGPVTKTNGTALTGGESTVRVSLDIEGTPNGLETIEITLGFNKKIVDLAGNEMLNTATTGIKYLNAMASSDKAITAFNFEELTPNVIGTVDEENKTIALTVPYGTNVTALVPTITHTGASISPDTGETQDFTSPVEYTVTAEYGSTQTYTVTVSVYGADINVQFHNNGSQVTTNTLILNFKITNSSTTSVKLSDVKLRYYYTVDGDKPQNFFCDQAMSMVTESSGYMLFTGSVVGTIVKMITATGNADYYLEIGFNTAHTLVPGAYAVIQSRVAKSDWSHYNRSNDYSFNSSATHYIESDKIVLLIDGNIVSGISPTALSLTAGAITRTSDTEATVKFTSNTAGEYYYAIVEDVATAPTIDTSGAGIACDTTENTITNPTGLTAGAKDIYIVVKDAAGNVSIPIKLDIPAYAASIATVQAITGTQRVGATLTGHYTYSYVNPEGTSTFKWYRADTGSGANKTPIAGATSLVYVLQTADIGKYISFEVTPVAAGTIAQGTSVESALVGPIVAAGGSSGNSTPVPPPAPIITVSEVKSELFENAEDIKVEADVNSAFGQSVEVKITDSAESQKEIFSLAGADGEVYPFDISLYSKESNQKVQPKDGYSVKITLPVPEKLLEDREQIKVVYGKDGKLETLKSELIEKDGKWYIVFEAVHFSPYALVVSAEPSVSWTNPFSDVQEGSWYYSAVEYVAQNGLMLGTGSNTFSPGITTNRGMIATILYRLNGSVETSESTFKDVIPGAYYAKAVAWAQEKGIIAGYGNGMFGPEDSITREQMATILWRYAGSPVVTESKGLAEFKDAVGISAYAKNALAWAHKQGIIAGKGNGILDPKGLATRAEVATIIINYVNTTEK